MSAQEAQNKSDKFKAKFHKWTENLSKMEERGRNEKLNKATDNNIVKDKVEELINSAKTVDNLNPDKNNTVDTKPLKTERRKAERRRTV
jgi:hypothetical protein